MASSAMITVPTTASRFALLQIDSDSDSDTSEPGKTSTKSSRDPSGKPRQGKSGSAGGRAAQGGDKKKDKKKKKREQQQSEANELRNLAFKKIPQKSSALPPCMTLSGIASELLSPPSGDHSAPSEGWQQWKQRDEQITTELYEADLEKALILSKLEYEQQKQNHTSTSSPKSRAGKEGGGKKDKKKSQQTKDKKTVSLQDFQAEGSAEHSSKKQDKEDPRGTNLALGAGQEERFFNKLEDDVSRIIQKEKRREQFTNSHAQEVNVSTEHEQDPRAEQLKYELEKKDLEIEKLKKTISQWEVKYKEVKARNSQLLKMLQQGEMKDKAEILLQVEELLHIKEELSSQVSLLHAALEQERSKVKGLQSEQPKHQSKRVSFYKRAQILVADFWGIMEARGDGDIINIDWLTMFADYRVPQALVHLGALRYTDTMMETLKKGELLLSGDRREVEIRGCSIWAVELIKQRLHELVQQRDGQTCSINSAVIDFYLWPYAKQHHKEMAHVPIHHTRCIYY